MEYLNEEIPAIVFYHAIFMPVRRLLQRHGQRRDDG
jgi:hypothetical protein